MPNYNYNPYAVRYGQTKGAQYSPQIELLPNFRRTPPPDVLQAQMQQTPNSFLPFPNNSVPSSYQPVQYQTLQGTARIPPLDVLQAQAKQTANDYFQTANDYANKYAIPALTYLGGQALSNGAILGVTGKTLGRHLTGGIGKALNTPQALATIATIEATKAGAPIVNGIRTFANSPAGQKAKNIFETAVNWIL